MAQPPNRSVHASADTSIATSMENNTAEKVVTAQDITPSSNSDGTVNQTRLSDTTTTIAERMSTSETPTSTEIIEMASQQKQHQDSYVWSHVELRVNSESIFSFRIPLSRDRFNQLCGPHGPLNRRVRRALKRNLVKKIMYACLTSYLVLAATGLVLYAVALIALPAVDFLGAVSKALEEFGIQVKNNFFGIQTLHVSDTKFNADDSDEGEFFFKNDSHVDVLHRNEPLDDESEVFLDAESSIDWHSHFDDVVSTSNMFVLETTPSPDSSDPAIAHSTPAYAVREENSTPDTEPEHYDSSDEGHSDSGNDSDIRVQLHDQSGSNDASEDEEIAEDISEGGQDLGCDQNTEGISGDGGQVNGDEDYADMITNCSNVGEVPATQNEDISSNFSEREPENNESAEDIHEDEQNLGCNEQVEEILGDNHQVDSDKEIDDITNHDNVDQAFENQDEKTSNDVSKSVVYNVEETQEPDWQELGNGRTVKTRYQLENGNFIWFTFNLEKSRLDFLIRNLYENWPDYAKKSVALSGIYSLPGRPSEDDKLDVQCWRGLIEKWKPDNSWPTTIPDDWIMRREWDTGFNLVVESILGQFFEARGQTEKQCIDIEKFKRSLHCAEWPNLATRNQCPLENSEKRPYLTDAEVEIINEGCAEYCFATHRPCKGQTLTHLEKRSEEELEDLSSSPPKHRVLNWLEQIPDQSGGLSEPTTFLECSCGVNGQKTLQTYRHEREWGLKARDPEAFNADWNIARCGNSSICNDDIARTLNEQDMTRMWNMSHEIQISQESYIQELQICRIHKLATDNPWVCLDATSVDVNELRDLNCSLPALGLNHRNDYPPLYHILDNPKGFRFVRNLYRSGRQWDKGWCVHGHPLAIEPSNCEECHKLFSNAYVSMNKHVVNTGVQNPPPGFSRPTRQQVEHDLQVSRDSQIQRSRLAKELQQMKSAEEARKAKEAEEAAAAKALIGNLGNFAGCDANYIYQHGTDTAGQRGPIRRGRFGKGGLFDPK